MLPPFVCSIPSVDWRLRGRKIQMGEWHELGKRISACDHCRGSQKLHQDRLSHTKKAGFIALLERDLSQEELEWTDVVLAAHYLFFRHSNFLIRKSTLLKIWWYLSSRYSTPFLPKDGQITSGWLNLIH